METSLNLNKQAPAQDAVETIGVVASAETKTTNTPSPLFNAAPETAGSIASASTSASSSAGGSSSCGSFSATA